MFLSQVTGREQQFSSRVEMLKVEQAPHREHPELPFLSGSCDSGSDTIDLLVQHLGNTRLDSC